SGCKVAPRPARGWRGLFELRLARRAKKGEFRSHLAAASTAGYPAQRGAIAGVPFFGFPFLGKQERELGRRAETRLAPTGAKQRRHQTPQPLEAPSPPPSPASGRRGKSGTPNLGDAAHAHWGVHSLSRLRVGVRASGLDRLGHASRVTGRRSEWISRC